MNQKLSDKAISELPIHVAYSLSRITKSHNHFKKLHLISDVLLGCFRLYGHAMIKIAEQENAINESTEQSIETLMSKDSHGLWSSTIMKLIQELDKQKSTALSPELASLFGVTLKSIKGQPIIKRMTIRNTVIDGKGQKQLVEVTNTPVELLINFRNKYVGHGTVYSETESKQIYKTYEPILDAFIKSLLACNEFQFKDATTGISIQGPNHICSGSIILDYQGKTFTLKSVDQLALKTGQIDSSNSKTSSINRDEVDSKIIETYPYFLAHPYKRALEEEDGFKRLHLLKEVFLNYLKYLGLLTASEYFNSDLKIGDINRSFINFLIRPQFGHWNAFMRSATQALNENGHRWFVKELPEYYDKVETQPYAATGDTSIGKLITFRNHYLGHSTVPSDQKCVSLWQENFGLLKDLLVKLDFCKNYTIVSSDKTVSWRLMGDEITQVNLRQRLKTNIAMLNLNNEQLGLAPFFILPGEAFTKEVSSRAKLMIYDQSTLKGGRIIFFSPESIYGETNNEQILEQLNILIREKEKKEPVSMKDLDETSWKAILKENNEATIQSLLSEKKVIKGIYQERQDAEVALRSWVGARAGLFFLAAEAGSGKTNLLVEMNRQYAERGLDTILLRGNRFRTPNIWEELCYRLNLTPESSLEEAGFMKYEQENPLMILIDGANENSNSKALFDSIIEFLEKYKGGHIKIVLSWRVNTKSELPQADEKYESIIYSDAKEGNREYNVIARSCHWLKPFNKYDIEKAWDKYSKNKNDRIGRSPKFTYEELTYHDRGLTELSVKKNASDQLDNPLLLRLFLELHHGKGLPKNKNRQSLWSIYAQKFDSTVINRICELMINYQKSIIPLDLVYNDEILGDLVRTIQIDSPYQQLIIEGVLTESVLDEKLFVYFTIEGFFHYLLGEIISKESINKDYNYFIELIKNNKLNGIKEGIENSLINEVYNGGLNRIIELIDTNTTTLLKITEYPIACAFINMDSNVVFDELTKKPTIGDWKVIKAARNILLDLQRNNTIKELDGILIESIDLKIAINELLKNSFEESKHDILSLIGFYTELNALDQAKQYYTQFIDEAEKRNDQNSLVVALEQLGDSEYKRSGHDGYKAAMTALTRAAEIREAEATPQKDKLKNNYRLLGFAYLSLGLQVVKSTEYFEKAKSIMLEEATDSAELAEINLYIGLVNFWRGLRGVGRWGHADPSLLEGLDVDLFEYADDQFQKTYNYHFKHLGKIHPQTFKALHYLQENRYAIGNYEKAIPWLKKYTESLPFKTKEHTDNFYRYCLVVSLEEHAKQLALTEPDKALALIQEAFQYIQNYDEGDEIATRLTNVNKQIEAGKIDEPVYSNMEELPPLETESRYKGIWSKWEFSDDLKGFQTNNWMVAGDGVWFFNIERKQLVFWDKETNSLSTFNPTHWPDGCGRMVYDQKNRIFYAWSSIRSTVFELSDPDGHWNRLSHGVHDVHACGASYAFDPINNRLFEFGGYGYFTYKNWLWVYDISEKKWIQLNENKPGISPYPRNGQLLPIENGTKAILISGIGSDTGIQREHKARLGLASATDVGYFTWLRDAHELDLASMEWKSILPTNHHSIRHEGSMGFVEKSKIIMNWAGSIPSPKFGQDAIISTQLSSWNLNKDDGFKIMNYAGEILPAGGGSFISMQGNNYLLYKINDEIYKLELTSL